MKKNKTLVIGWDAADWKFLSPLIDEGLMPNLEGLINEGVMGKLSTLDPPLSPTLWTSIATGKRPYKHGIHGFTEPRPDGKGLRPMYITSRKCKAIWNILTQHKLKTHVVGWWPSHPAEPINGIMVSNLYQRSHKTTPDQWPMMNGTVHPEEKASIFKDIRVHQMELTGNHVDPFVPAFNTIDQQSDRRPGSIAAITAECASIHNAATYILEYEDWDFMGVYYDGIDHYCHGFMKYHPPHRPHIPKKDFEMYKDVVKGACRFHDMMLGRLLELAGPDTNIILISDHGFHPDHNRPIKIPKEPMGPASEHSPYGIIVMKGPDIKKDEIIHGAGLLDITPTILQLYGLPIGDDMDGKVLANVFEQKPQIEYIDSWENIEGEDGSHPEGLVIDVEDTEQELQQLIDLGYIEDYGDDYEKAIKNTIAENKFTLAKAYIDGSEWTKGIELLERLHEEFPDKLHFTSRLIHAYQVTGQLQKARVITDVVKDAFPHKGIQLDLLEGSLLFAENKPKAALEHFLKVKKEAGDFFGVNLRIAQALLRINKHNEALDSVNKALELNAENERAYYLKGFILYQLLKYEDALESLLACVGLDYYQPACHYMIGECLSAIGKNEEAIEAFETSLSQNSDFNKAREKIIFILTNILNQPGRARQYQVDFEEHIEGTIHIVSGLPRSGTSLMMQMLEAGGLKIFSDAKREADENNPKGYLEHEAVKNLSKDHSFLKRANGKTVKVIANLLNKLPSKYKYKVVFMRRDLSEIIQSQQRMLIRDGIKANEDTLPLRLHQSFENTIDKAKRWMDAQQNVEFIEINYAELITNPFEQAIEIDRFFSNENLAVEKMALVPDKKLYREQNLKMVEV